MIRRPCYDRKVLRAVPRWLCAALLALAGCGGGTTLLLSVSLAEGRPQPDRLRVTLYGNGLLRAPSELPLASAGRALPGTVFVGGLDAATPNFRLLLDGLGATGTLTSQAAAQAQLAAGANTRLALTLGAQLPDADGDGVPDAIDDCPTVPDSDQRCVPSDLGSTVEDLPAPPPDLTAPDLGRVSCPGFSILCDTFEDASLGAWLVDLDTKVTGNSVRVSKTAFNGLYSAEALSPVNPGDGNYPSTYAFLAKSFRLTTPPAMVAARVYLNSPQKPGSFENVLGLFNGTLGWGVGADSSGNWVIAQDYAMNPDIGSKIPFPFGRWVCVELRVDYGAGRVQVYADGQLVVDGAYAVATVPTELDVGAVRSAGMTASDLFLDDAVLATQPIGCE